MKGSIAPLFDRYLLKESEALMKPSGGMQDDSGEVATACDRDPELGAVRAGEAGGNIIRRDDDVEDELLL